MKILTSVLGIGGLLVSLAIASEASADDHLAWPQFRGPAGSGIAEGQNPPIEIGPEKNVQWKVAAPGGPSSPIVVGDKLVITAFDEGKLYTIAYNRADGSEAWRAEAPFEELEPYHPQEGSPAASTPATDGQRIVAYFGSCGLFCYDLDGNELWRHEMPPAKTMMNFGSGTSPIIADGTVVLLRDVASDSVIVALDMATGDVKWERKRTSPVGYCTPVAWETPAGIQIAAPGNGQMTGYDLQTGEEKWHVVGMPSATCASPLAAGGDLFFAAWSPGGPGDTEFQMPTFDQLLQGDAGDADGDGALSKEEVSESEMKDFFDHQDSNKDGLLTRDEWDAVLAFMAAAESSAFALEPGGTGDVTTSHVRWKKKEGLPYVPSAIAYQGQLVMVKDGGILSAYDTQTGAEIYLKKRAITAGNYYASPVAAGGRIYFTALANGAVTVIEAGANEPKVLARNEPLGERVAATPAIADDTLYIRGAEHLYAFGR